MIVVVNGTDRDVTDGCDLTSVVRSITALNKGVAAAVNGDVIPVGQWSATTLRPGDRVEILGASPGG